MNYIKINIERYLNDDSQFKCDAPMEAVTGWHRSIGKEKFYDQQKEHLVVFLVDSRLQVIDWSLISVGISNQTLAKVADVLKPAIIRGANGLIVAHNHPSGDCSPSKSDLSITKKIHEGCQIMDIDLLDHIIVSSRTLNATDYYSFKENGRFA